MVGLGSQLQIGLGTVSVKSPYIIVNNERMGLEVLTLHLSISLDIDERDERKNSEKDKREVEIAASFTEYGFHRNGLGMLWSKNCLCPHPFLVFGRAGRPDRKPAATGW